MAQHTIAFPSRFASHELAGLAVFVESFDGTVIDAPPAREGATLTTWLVDIPDEYLVPFNSKLIDAIDELALLAQLTDEEIDAMPICAVCGAQAPLQIAARTWHLNEHPDDGPADYCGPCFAHLTSVASETDPMA